MNLKSLTPRLSNNGKRVVLECRGTLGESARLELPALEFPTVVAKLMTFVTGNRIDEALASQPDETHGKAQEVLYCEQLDLAAFDGKSVFLRVSTASRLVDIALTPAQVEFLIATIPLAMRGDASVQ